MIALVNVFRRPGHLSKKDIALVVLPFVFWFLAVKGRSHIIEPICSTSPEQCAPHEVNRWDRSTVGNKSLDADHLSFATQYLVGALAFGTPLSIAVFRGATGVVSWPLALGMIAADWVVLLETVGWNGLVTEINRLTVQRPRPFVYENPTFEGKNPANYTSFLSGHTTFVAAASMALLLILLGRGVNGWWIFGISLLSAISAFLTAWLRVVSGRHFPSDVLAATVSGIIVALLIAILHRPISKKRD